MIRAIKVRLAVRLCHRHTNVALCAEYLRLLREKEKAAGLSGDDDIDAFLKASALQGKRHSVVTEYILKLLGLDVRAPPCTSPRASAPEAECSHASVQGARE